MTTPDLFTQNFAEIKVIYNTKVRPQDMLKITNSQDAYDAMLSVTDGELEHVEYFWIILLNRSNKVLGYYQVSKGGIAGTIVDPKVVFGVALKASSASILLIHNHPSGNKFPSDADIALTERLKNAGLILDCPVTDHIIITQDGYYSFADNGKI